MAKPRKFGKSSVLRQGAEDKDMKTYENTGVTQLHIGDQYIDPGEVFRAALNDAVEQHLVLGGHITIVQDASRKPDKHANPEPPIKTEAEKKAERGK